MEKIIEEIIQKKKHVYFISPSFGDVAAYAGDLFTYLSGKVEITIVNVFTSGGDGRTTYSARQFLRSFAIPTAERLYEVLDTADVTALQPFEVNRINLGLPDALWRRRKMKGGILSLSLFKSLAMRFPEMESLYPVFITHVLSGKIANEDKNTEQHLVTKLREAVKDPETSVVFCPLGYGKHVDYLLVRNAVSKAFGERVVYCADISNVLQFAERERFISENNLFPLLYKSEQSELKLKLLKSYKQFENQEENYMHPEIYYINSSFLVHSSSMQIVKQSIEGNYEVKQYKKLSEELLEEWGELWRVSANKHYFNSPEWFQACKQAFPLREFIVITVYEKGTLLAVLPLVKENKYGQNIYKMPGGKYFDRSPLLLKVFDKSILQMLFGAAKQVGSFYFSEIDRYTLDCILPWIKSVSSAETSISPFWQLQPDAFRFLAWRNKKTLLKRLAEEKDNFELRIFTAENKKHLKTLLEIEQASSKGRDFKNTFSDNHLLSLYAALKKLAPGSVWFVILYYKNEPICYNYGFHYDDVYSCCGTSFKLQYKQFAPGLLLTYLALPKLEEMGIRLFDFSRGVSRYKRDFTPYSYQQYSIAYGSNMFVSFWLSSLDRIRVWLEHHPKWYERVRVTKNRIQKFVKL